MVYFIRSSSGAVKIGHTTDVDARFRCLQCATPDRLTLVRTIPGGRMVERWLHQRFRHLRIRGEWFHYVEAMAEVDPPREPELDSRPPGARRMRELRSAYGKTQAECAAHLGIAQPTYAEMESGVGRFRRRDLVALALLYGMEPDEAFPVAWVRSARPA